MKLDRFLNPFSLTEIGVSLNKKNSYTKADLPFRPDSYKSLRTFFKAFLGQISPSFNSERKKGVFFSKGIVLLESKIILTV